MDDDESRYEAQRLALSRAVALTGITATLSFPVAFYARSSSPAITSVPIMSSDGRGYYLVALLVVIVIGAIVQLLQNDDPAGDALDPDWRFYGAGPAATTPREHEPATAWMLPAVALFASYLFLAIYHRLAYVMLVPLVAAGMVFAARVVRFHVLNGLNGSAQLARGGQVILTYPVAFAALTIVYMFKARSLYSGALVSIFAFLLLMQLADGLAAGPARRVLYAVVGAIGLAQLTWALNYWNTTAWFGGAILTTMFVFVGSIMRLQCAGQLTQRVVVERAAIAVPVLAALAYFAE